MSPSTPLSVLGEAIVFHVDKGSSRRWVAAEVLKMYPTTLPQLIHAEIDLLTEKGTLTEGMLHGDYDFLVVTEWMPNAVAKMNAARAAIDSSAESEI